MKLSMLLACTTLACAPWLGLDISTAQEPPANQEDPSVLEGHGDGIYSLAFAKGGALLASASKDGTIKIWDPADGSEQATLEGHKGQVLRLAFSAENLLASGGADKTVRLWDVAKG